jgi:hypothetical protein
MPSGMQAWDANGNLIVDFTTRLSRVLGTIYINGQSGYTTDPNIGSSGGQPFTLFQPTTLFQHISGDAPRPVIVVSGNTISWTYSGAVNNYHAPIPGWLFWGVY